MEFRIKLEDLTLGSGGSLYSFTHVPNAPLNPELKVLIAIAERLEAIAEALQNLKQSPLMKEKD